LISPFPFIASHSLEQKVNTTEEKR